MSCAIRCVTTAFSGCSASSLRHPGAVPSAYGRRSFAKRFIGSREMSAMS
jgi:hypothetical protein